MSGLIVIAGPTASGKSALALRLAERLGGVTINADSMQLYRELRALTARPSAAEEARAPHRLYGALAADDAASVGRWLALAEAAIKDAASTSAWAVVVGGTGLYLRALLHGLAPIPEIPPAVRAEVRGLDIEDLRARLAALDAEGAERLHDRQRLLRALEVVLATGRGLLEWQRLPHHRPALPEPRLGLALVPAQDALAARIEQRLRAMIAAGALEELEVLRALRLDPALPLMKAQGVPELIAQLEGRLSLEEAVARAAARTRQYARRQGTWLRHQLPELPRVAAFGEELEDLDLASLPLSPIAPDAPTLPAAPAVD